MNIQTIQIVHDDLAPLALGLKGGFGKRAFIQPQKFFQTRIPISIPEDAPTIKSFKVEVVDVEGRVYSQEMFWAMG